MSDSQFAPSLLEHAEFDARRIMNGHVFGAAHEVYDAAKLLAAGFLALRSEIEPKSWTCPTCSAKCVPNSPSNPQTGGEAQPCVVVPKVLRDACIEWMKHADHKDGLDNVESALYGAIVLCCHERNDK